MGSVASPIESAPVHRPFFSCCRGLEFIPPRTLAANWSAPAKHALKLQRALVDGELIIVAKGSGRGRVMLKRTPEAELPPRSPWLERVLKAAAIAIFLGMVALFIASMVWR